MSRLLALTPFRCTNRRLRRPHLPPRGCCCRDTSCRWRWRGSSCGSRGRRRLDGGDKDRHKNLGADRCIWRTSCSYYGTSRISFQICPDGRPARRGKIHKQRKCRRTGHWDGRWCRRRSRAPRSMGISKASGRRWPASRPWCCDRPRSSFRRPRHDDHLSRGRRRSSWECLRTVHSRGSWCKLRWYVRPSGGQQRWNDRMWTGARRW